MRCSSLLASIAFLAHLVTPVYTQKSAGDGSTGTAYQNNNDGENDANVVTASPESSSSTDPPTPAPPPDGSVLTYTMESKVPGSGDLNFQLSFRQESPDVLKMTCKMRATGDALQYFPETRNISINVVDDDNEGQSLVRSVNRQISGLYGRLGFLGRKGESDSPVMVAFPDTSCNSLTAAEGTSRTVQGYFISSIKSHVIDAEETVDSSTGITYSMLERACVVIMVPNSRRETGGIGRSYRGRSGRNLVMNLGQIGARSVAINLATFALLSVGAKSIVLPAVVAPAVVASNFNPVVISSSSSSTSDWLPTIVDSSSYGNSLVLPGASGPVMIFFLLIMALMINTVLVGPYLASFLPIPQGISKTYHEYIGEPLERLGAEAERRIDIAQQNFNNAVTTFKTRHDQINRLPIKQILNQNSKGQNARLDDGNQGPVEDWNSLGENSVHVAEDNLWTTQNEANSGQPHVFRSRNGEQPYSFFSNIAGW